MDKLNELLQALAGAPAPDSLAGFLEELGVAAQRPPIEAGGLAAIAAAQCQSDQGTGQDQALQEWAAALGAKEDQALAATLEAAARDLDDPRVKAYDQAHPGAETSGHVDPAPPPRPGDDPSRM